MMTRARRGRLEGEAPAEPRLALGTRPPGRVNAAGRLRLQLRRPCRSLALQVCCAIALVVLSANARAAEGPDERRIVTYNVLADEVNVEVRVPELFRILRESNADIITLQEAGRPRGL